MPTTTTDRPWETLSRILSENDGEKLKSFLHDLSSGETARSISRLSSQEQNKLLTILEPDVAADVIEEVSQAQAGVSLGSA